MRSTPTEATLAGYRLLRRIASGERADVFLATVDERYETAPDEPSPLVVVRVYDAAASGAALAVEIEAMSTDASGSLPELFDVATLDDGRCALAVERLSGPSLARLLAERRLAAGEAVTILAPIVVAMGELARLGFVHTRLTAGDVQLDGEGRPRLIGLGSLARLPVAPHERTPLLRAGHVALAELIDDVVACTDRPEQLMPVAELLHDRVAARPFTPCEGELERALFAVAAPMPVGGVVVTARRPGLPARMTAPLHPVMSAGPDPTDAPTGRPRDDQGAARDDQGAQGRRTLLELAQWPAFLAGGDRREHDRAAGTGLAARVRLAVRRRRSSLLVAGLAGGGVLTLLLTMVPPAAAGGDGVDGPAGAGSGESSPGGRGGAAADPEATAGDAVAGDVAAGGAEAGDAAAAPGGPAADDDVVSAVQRLLERRQECFDALDLTCLSEVVQPGSALESADAAAMAAARDGGKVPAELDATGVSIVTEMGSAVLLTAPYAGVAAEREPASLLVMRSEAGWRLREIFD
ncbi:hypothetical protein ACWGST_09660 [Agromyces sp. NPDC055520]